MKPRTKDDWRTVLDAIEWVQAHWDDMQLLQTRNAEMARLLKFVLAKSDKPMWLSDGWREDAAAVLAALGKTSTHG